jgi:hypothetical protein
MESKEVVLQPDTADYRRLQAWIAGNQKGWSPSWTTNPAGGVLVYAGDLRLQFVDTAVFALTKRGQFQKEIKEHDYAFLRRAAGI